MQLRCLALVTVAVLGATTGIAGSKPPAAAPVERTVYVTVADNNGSPVTDLTPADFVVKEGGKEREITKAAPATTRVRLALAVEERLVGDNNVRVAIFEFAKRMMTTSEIALITIGLRNTVVADYSTSLDAVVGGINKFTLNPARESAVAEGVLDLARGFTQAKPERPVIVVMSLSGGQTGVAARTVLDQLRDSGAIMYSVTLGGGDNSAAPLGSMGDQSGREQVLGEGPKQSGGRRVDVTAPGAMVKAMQQVANDISAQYAITYVLPDGVKPDRRFGITVKRRGVSLRAPSAIPDR
jgi:VWFA-related protein